jgi:hypothetical protein
VLAPWWSLNYVLHRYVAAWTSSSARSRQLNLTFQSWWRFLVEVGTPFNAAGFCFSVGTDVYSLYPVNLLRRP